MKLKLKYLSLRDRDFSKDLIIENAKYEIQKEFSNSKIFKVTLQNSDSSIYVNSDYIQFMEIDDSSEPNQAPNDGLVDVSEVFKRMK